jgi:hypothetical protein
LPRTGIGADVNTVEGRGIGVKYGNGDGGDCDEEITSLNCAILYLDGIGISQLV